MTMCDLIGRYSPLQTRRAPVAEKNFSEEYLETILLRYAAKTAKSGNLKVLKSIMARLPQQKRSKTKNNRFRNYTRRVKGHSP